MLARHHNLEPQQIELAGSGTGGVEELVANLDDGNILYGLGARAAPPAPAVGTEPPCI